MATTLYIGHTRDCASGANRPCDCGAVVRTPTARDLFEAMVALRAGRITPDECRAVMRRSREAHGESEHSRLKAVAVANLGQA